MYCMYARKEASEAPRTHFRACKIAKFPGGVPPDPPLTQAILWAPHFSYLPRAPTILLAALVGGVDRVCVIKSITQLYDVGASFNRRKANGITGMEPTER